MKGKLVSTGSHRQLLNSILCALCGSVVISATLPIDSDAADTVTLRSPSGGPSYTVEGTITDYRGGQLTIDQGRGRAKAYPAGRVVRIETTWPDGYQAAKAALDGKQWSAAARGFAAAARAESRPWAKRRLLVDLLRCRLALGEIRRAGDLLIALDTSDPATPAWALAPLPWYASDEVAAAAARVWLARPEESARLLGAAWLLATPDRSAAQAELRSLTRSRRPTIARLAECQLWRLDLLRADRRQTDRWAERVAALPTELAPGPRHLLAQAYLRQKRYDEAALTALEYPLTGRSPHRLAARGLLLAAKALLAASHADEATRLLNEITCDYADTPQRQDAKALLRTLTD